MTTPQTPAGKFPQAEIADVRASYPEAIAAIEAEATAATTAQIAEALWAGRVPGFTLTPGEALRLVDFTDSLRRILAATTPAEAQEAE